MTIHKQFSIEISVDNSTDIYGKSVKRLHFELHPKNYYWLENVLNSNPALRYKEMHVEPNLWCPWKSKIVIDYYC